MPQEARKKLADVHPEHNFRMSTGEEIKNLSELKKTLQEINEETFNRHVTEDRNDFANWLRDAVGDMELADKIEKVKEPNSLVQIIEDRILYLKNKVEIGDIMNSIDQFQSEQVALDKKPPLVEAKKDNLLPPEREIKDPAMNVLGEGQAGTNGSQPEAFQSINELDNSKPAPVLESQKLMDTPPKIKSTNDVSKYSIPNYPNNDHHPLEIAKRHFHHTVRDALIGFVMGSLAGFIVGYFVW